MSGPDGHVPVLPGPVLELLSPRPGETAFDLTAGRGGHSVELAARVAPGGTVLLCDLDPGNLEHARARVAGLPGTTVIGMHGTFSTVDREASRLGIAADCVLADLGFSSSQMDDPLRGLSFQGDGPLDMRLDPTRGETAADLVSRLPERELADVIFRLGEDPFARRIARVIVDRRARAAVGTTRDLAAAVVAAYGARARQSRIHPATRTFQALRILVNDELGALAGLLAGLEAGGRRAAAGEESWVRPGCRVAVIAFHSLEDRLVKQAMASWERQGIGERLVRKPVEPGEAEVAANRRSRSAKLRAFRFTAGPAAE